MGNTFQTGRLINGLFVDASGNVGIGTTTPAEKLSVIGNIRIDNGAADGGQLVLASSGFSDWNLDNFSGRFRAYYGATERFTITASGAVGIGTNNPQSLLDVKGATPFIRITDSSVTGETGIIMDASGGFIRGGLTINYGTGEYKSYCGIAGNSYFQTFHTNGSERMRISSNGNVGIGTSSPTNTLTMLASSTSTGKGIDFVNYASTSQVLGQLTFEQVNDFLTLKHTIATGGINFYTYNTERMRITSGGTLSLNGRFIHQGVSRLCYAGTVAGSGSFSVNLVVGSQSAVKITAAMNHYGYIDGYGCAKMAWVGSTPAFSQIVISEVTSGNGGSWSFTNGGSGIITITKNAGSYGGGGYYFIEVVGNDPQSIS